jgi:thioredoxin 1
MAAADDPGGDAPAVTVEDRDHFDRLRERHDLLLADFYGDWCGPCVVVGDFLESVAAETPATVAEIDVEANEGLADDHAVRSLPTVVMFRDGEPVERLVGMQDEERYRQLVERYAD